MAFSSPEIRFCHWHMFRAMRAQANSKITNYHVENVQMVRRSGVSEFKMLVYTRTVKDFGTTWANYQAQFGHLKEWIDYVERTWMSDPIPWWVGARRVSDTVDTFRVCVDIN